MKDFPKITVVPEHNATYQIDSVIKLLIDQLTAENKALRKDAERYRFLRGSDRCGHEEDPPYVATDDQSGFIGDRLDLLVDKSMTALEKFKSSF